MLPIDEVLAPLNQALTLRPNAVLVAPPGSGKTTRVPLAMLEAPWLNGRKIVMLEPRRLAARSVAGYMAKLRGEKVGDSIGYRVKHDTKVSAHTRIEVITEGVLTRMLQQDPSLDGIGAVLFDEFHERSLHSDLGLALCLQSQSLFREDLRLLIMSATMDAESASALLGDAPVVTGEGRMFPVETRHLPRRAGVRVEDAVVTAVQQALAQDEGDVLAFLPGAAEIRRAQAGLSGVSPGVRVLPLYGSLPQAAQEAAIAPAKPGERKVVLATSIAETSLTVDGVRIVVDGGTMRVPRFSPRTGMTRLETVPVSRASADQRRGRAGRTAPGICYRLWTEQEDLRLEPRSTPEVLEADLAPLALALAAWGVADPDELSWLDPPPAPAYAQARALLRRLGALTEAGAITPHGHRMAELGLHPRLAHMLLRAQEMGWSRQACDLAALLRERDIVRYDRSVPNVDVMKRASILQEARQWRGELPESLGGLRVDSALCRRIITEADHLIRMLRSSQAQSNQSEKEQAYTGDVGVMLGWAYPDRIAQLRSSGRFTLANGRGAAMEAGQALAYDRYIVAVDLDDQGVESRIYLAASLSLEHIEEHFQTDIRHEEIMEWDNSARAVRARKRLLLGGLLLKETPMENPDPERVLTVLMEGIRLNGLDMLSWKRPERQMQERMQFMHKVNPEQWPDASEAGLLDNLETWLGPHAYGMKSRSDLQKIPLTEALADLISYEQRVELNHMVPTHMTLPSGSRVPLDYSNPDQPVLAARLQELFGWKETPRIGGGRVPLTIHLLSPAQRPVQVTQDLASFWKTAYYEVRKDLKGRYPKHYWPDNPLEAPATSRTRPKA
ncbi:ATP-dependent helicase [Paenibacillus swuensis]|uniref:ATP-dependent helicase n=2 Tax=Paenibacillus swuensis TaxID=1178515 RepID=A0A172TKX8_9BACL|nr:ATP-dependent helicase HrpB [Paenibacillus swuensis]ANE47632.1 ATP-dependent helicase [Paenibacillus swuensis]